MSRRNREPPLSILNSMMANAGITPRYTVIYEDYTRGKEMFMIRVTCPVRRGSPPVSADSSYCRSKKEAKHSAARVYMEKFFNSDNDQVQSPRIRRTSPREPIPARAVTMSSKELDILEEICSKKNLGRPEIKDLGVAGLSRAPTFTAECLVFGLCIEGKGYDASEARLQAIVRMIQILTRTPMVHEILKLPKLTLSEIEHTLKSTNDDLVSSSSDQTSQPNTQSGMNGNRNTDPKSYEKPKDTRTISDRAKALLEFMNAHKKPEKIRDRNNNSVLNVNRMQKAERGSDSGNSEVDSTSGIKFRGNLTQLQVISQIDRTLGNLEEQLYDKLLNALSYLKLSKPQTVVIPSYKFEVSFEESFPPKITIGSIECTDLSMRMACLTQLLIDLKKLIKNSYL